ncbi:MAG: S8 family serine peptidase [candidate division Zixibacteria bacterium]|nr:S8 family serine peptidase [candidate division Zixibacteria bacterium]
MSKNSISIKAISFFFLIIFSFCTEFSFPDPLSIPPDKIDNKTLVFLQKLPPDSLSSFWIFFKDKGPIEQGAYEKNLQENIFRFPERTIQRRSLKGNGTLVDFYDLPVCPFYVDSLKSTGVKIKTVSRWLNAVSIIATVKDIERIAEFGFVQKIQKVATFYRPLPEIERKAPEYKKSLVPEILDYGLSYAQLLQIHVPELHRLGYTGKGIRIGMLDTGYFLHHRAFQYLIDSNRIVATRDFINGDSNVEDSPDIQRLHGTYTLSALAGYSPGNLIGPAYNSEFVLAKTEIAAQEIQIEEDYWVAGIEWEESLGVDIVSSSLGYTDWYTPQGLDTALCTRAANIAVSKGVVVVNSAGNERNLPWHYIIAPANGDSVIAVGAVDLNGNIASFSSVGFPWDFQKGKIKPDVCACGVGTYCANVSGGYSNINGTSLSTPLVAGACALILQADTTIKPMQLRDRLWRTAYGVSSPDTLYGYGIVDAVRAAGFNYALVQTEKKIFAFPNPFEDNLTVLVKVPQSSQVQFSIFNSAGERVLKSNPSLYDSENYVFFWKGKNEKNEEVASGIYLVKVDIDGNSEIIKVYKNK